MIVRDSEEVEALAHRPSVWDREKGGDAKAVLSASPRRGWTRAPAPALSAVLKP